MCNPCPLLWNSYNCYFLTFDSSSNILLTSSIREYNWLKSFKLSSKLIPLLSCMCVLASSVISVLIRSVKYGNSPGLTKDSTAWQESINYKHVYWHILPVEFRYYTGCPSTQNTFIYFRIYCKKLKKKNHKTKNWLG